MQTLSVAKELLLTADDLQGKAICKTNARTTLNFGIMIYCRSFLRKANKGQESSCTPLNVGDVAKGLSAFARILSLGLQFSIAFPLAASRLPFFWVSEILLSLCARPSSRGFLRQIYRSAHLSLLDKCLANVHNLVRSTVSVYMLRFLVVYIMKSFSEKNNIAGEVSHKGSRFHRLLNMSTSKQVFWPQA